MANINQECCISIMGLNVHNFIASIFQTISNNRIKQKVLWLFDAFLSWPRSKTELQLSVDCMRYNCISLK